jgi:predicted nucleotidyltransferase
MSVARTAGESRGLRLLVLHGSRARGTAHGLSDWDFAYLSDADFDPDALLARLSEELASDSVDLADLSRASGLLRFKVAGDGLLLFERDPGLFDRFRLDAITAWCDMEPILGRAYEAQLTRLAR